MDAWGLWQLADSGFPSGGFAHSGGLEALWHLGLVRDEASLTLRLGELGWHLASSAGPFAAAAHAPGADLAALDDAQDVVLSNHVANRASRAQGRALLMAVEAMAALPAVTAARAALPHGHLSVATGACLQALGASREEARRFLLFSAVRGALSAAVRLGVLGPLRAQAVLRELLPGLAAALEATAGLAPADAAGAAPLLEVAQAAHDSLYSRLFQS